MEMQQLLDAVIAGNAPTAKALTEATVHDGTAPALVAAGLRDEVKLQSGCAPVTDESRSHRADGYGRDAGAATERAKQLIAAAV